jgi:hypothetical protein
MKTKLFFFLGASALFFSCGSSNSENAETTETIEIAVVEEIAAIDTISDNYMLLKNQCLICHGGAPSHDELIAPPMAAIKWRYKKQYDNKADFVEGVVAWGLNPTEETALMKGAVKEFNIMPKPATKEADLEIIAAFIYDNELEQPAWFEAHFEKMHGKKGKGMGMKNKND